MALGLHAIHDGLLSVANGAKCVVENHDEVLVGLEGPGVLSSGWHVDSGDSISSELRNRVRVSLATSIVVTRGLRGWGTEARQGC